MSDDLVTWLRAQLDEDATAERRTSGGTWDYDPTDGWITNEDSHVLAVSDGAPGDIDHVTRYSPAAVRADIAAKRALLEETIRPYLGADTTAGRVALVALRLLTSAYAHRPGYREEWRP